MESRLRKVDAGAGCEELERIPRSAHMNLKDLNLREQKVGMYRKTNQIGKLKVT